METFLTRWSEAATTTCGFFWKALWAFILGYIISGSIQVFVTRAKMKEIMGEGEGGRGVLLGTFFGFISSSCSFAALATTKSLFKKGASMVAAMAFLLASTNLVVELGIVIAVFLGWRFIVGEYVGGVVMILLAWLLLKIIQPKKMISQARERLGGGDDDDGSASSNRNGMFSVEGWKKVADKYCMEWKMVWKDVTVGFTVAGVIAVFVPKSFFQTLFIDSGAHGNPGFLAVLEHVLIAPVAAFFTFIGSMGNIPLATVLFANGVSFGGVMAFIFSDLVVFPVLRINAKYYGWKMSAFIVLILLAALSAAALLLHWSFAFVGWLPEHAINVLETHDFFSVDHTLFLNAAFLLISAFLMVWHWRAAKNESGDMGDSCPHHDDSAKDEDEKHDQQETACHADGGNDNGKGFLENILFYLALVAYAWIVGGLLIHFLSF